MQRPVLQLVIHPGSSSKAELPQKVYDRAENYRKGSPVRIELVGARSASEPIELTDDKGALMALEECSDGDGRCIIPHSIGQLTNGARLRLSGVTAKGAPAAVEYSLVGYRAAVAAIAAECSNDFIGREMVRR